MAAIARHYCPHIARLLASLLLSALLASCVPEPTEIIPVVPDPAPTHLKGVTDLILARPSVPIRILFIHGMGSSPTDCPFAPLMAELLNKLGNVRDPSAGMTLQICDNGIPVPEPVKISVPDTDLKANLFTYRYHEARSSRSMVFEFLNWAPLTEPLKQNLLQEKGHPSWPEQAVATAGVKDFFRTHISDVVIYAGTYRKVIRTAVEKALCILVGGTPDGSGRNCSGDDGDSLTVLITHSLGGYILADAIADLDAAHPALSANAAGQDAAAKTIAGTNLVFMIANQLALLDTTTLRGWGQSSADADGLAQDMNAGVLRTVRRHWREHNRHKEDGLQIVAITDPNDILSYLVPKSAIDAGSDTVVANIYTNTTANIAGVAANSVSAHVNYLSERKVADIIACDMNGTTVGHCE